MGRCEDKVTGAIYDGSFFLGVASPKYEYQSVAVSIEFTDCSIGKLFPTLSLMGSGLTGTDSQGGVQKQHALLRPARQVTVCGNGLAQIIAYLLEYVSQRRRERDTFIDREAQSVCLAWFMVGVLPYYDHLDLVKRAKVKGVEYQTSGRIDRTMGVLFLYKVCQSLEIGLVKLCLEMLLPTLVYPNVHKSSELRIENSELRINAGSAIQFSIFNYIN